MIPRIEGHLVDAGCRHGAGINWGTTELGVSRLSEVKPLEQAGAVPRPELPGTTEVRYDYPVWPRDVVVDGEGIDGPGLNADEEVVSPAYSFHEAIRLRGEDVDRSVRSVGQIHQLRVAIEIRNVVPGKGPALDVIRAGRHRDSRQQDVH